MRKSLMSARTMCHQDVYKRQDFIPSSMVLSAVDSRLRMEMGVERMLASMLEPLRDRYDFVIRCV